MKGIKYLAAASMVAAAVVFMSASDSSISQSGDTTVVNTTLIGKNIRGFKGQTPVKIFIKDNKVMKVEALDNKETPKFFNRAKAVLAEFNGKSVSKAGNMKVDGVSGATYSSKALIENVQTGLKYYKEQTKK